MIFVLACLLTVNTHLALCINSVINVNMLVDVKTLVGAFSVIVKTSWTFVARSTHYIHYGARKPPRHRRGRVISIMPGIALSRGLGSAHPTSPHTGHGEETIRNETQRVHR